MFSALYRVQEFHSTVRDRKITVHCTSVVTAISWDKCIDTQVLSKYCIGYKMWGSKNGIQNTGAGKLNTTVK